MYPSEYAATQPTKKISYLVSHHILRCRETMISVVPVNNAENIESESSFRWEVDILIAELPIIRHRTFGADMTFISVIEDESGKCLLFEFLQFLGFIRIDAAARVYLGVFPYTPMRKKSPKSVLVRLLAGGLLLDYFRFLHTLPIVLDDNAHSFFVRTVHD